MIFDFEKITEVKEEESSFEILQKKERKPIPSKESIIRNHIEVRFNDEVGGNADNDNPLQKFYSSQAGGNVDNKNKDCNIFYGCHNFLMLLIFVLNHHH